MADKREAARYRKRLKIVYAVDDVRQAMGMSENISEKGLFIRSVILHPPNTHLRIELTTGDDEPVVLIGKVGWVRRMPLKQIRQGKLGGMGIEICRFVSGLQSYLILCKSLREKSG